MNARPAPDYWIVRLDGAYAVRSAAGIVPGLEGIATYGEAEDHIRDLIFAARDDDAALDDFEAIEWAEAA